MTEQELLALYHARSEEALAETQALYGAYCRAIALRILGNEEDMQECLGDVWLRVWQAIPPEHPTHFKGWLGVITRNRAISLLRVRERAPGRAEEVALELAQALGGPEESLDAQELGKAVSAFLFAQPQEKRGVFLRRYWYGDRVEEAAGWAGWSVSKTKTVLFRLRRDLRSYLKKEGLYDE